ncbi:oligosaccharide flippase family protein [Patescibacteria group bacterium]|nr:oligosaccharide flippase family protein [Patescibacteria group bacterium]MBU4511785.1 oligosaccharide flippase family protein [Patescibacteria group bacterium]
MIQKIKQKLYPLLRISQKYTGTDNVYIFKQGGVLYFGNMIAALVSFVSAIAFARLLSKTTYGEYKYILSLLNLAGIATLRHLNTVITQAVAQKYEGIVKKGFLAKIKWGIIGSLVCFTLAGYFYFQGNLAFFFCMLLSGFLLPLFEACDVYIYYLQGKKLFTKLVLYQSLSIIISAVAIIFTISITRNLVILFAVFLTVNTLLKSIFLLVTLKKHPANNKSDPKFLKFGKELSIFGIISMAARELDRVLLFNFIDAAGVAIYSFAVMPEIQMTEILKNLRTIALPKFATRTREELKKTLLTKVLKLFLVVLLGVILYALIAPTIFQIFFPKYMDSVVYSQVFFLSLLTFPATILELAFQAGVMKKELYSLKIFSTTSSIILLFILTPIFGIWGVIAARLITSFAKAGLTLMFFKKM